MNNLTQKTVATIHISFAIILLFFSIYLSFNTLNEKQLQHDDNLKQFISIYSIFQKIQAQELSEDDDDYLTSEVIDNTEIEEFNDDLESESLDQVDNNAAIDLSKDIETPFDDLESESLDQVDNNAIDLSKDIETPFDDLESESLDQVDNNAIECLSNVTIAQSTNNNCSNDVINPDITLPSPLPIEEPTTTTDFIDPMDEQPIEPIPDPLVTEIPPSEPDVDPDRLPIIIDDKGRGLPPPPPIIGPDGLPIIIDDRGLPPPPPIIGPDGLPIIIDDRGLPPPPPIIGPDGLPIIIDDRGLPPPPPIIGPDGLPILGGSTPTGGPNTGNTGGTDSSGVTSAGQNYNKCCDNSISTMSSQLPVSWELKKDWKSGLPFYKHPILCNLSDEMKFVFSWIKANKNKIIEVGTKRGIDPVAIAGAIAWEALENVKEEPIDRINAWSGPGKVHYKLNVKQLYDKNEQVLPYLLNTLTVAEQVEIAGYLPESTEVDRREILSSTSGSIEYIGAIMRALADVPKKIGYNIDNDPSKLAYFYNVKDLNEIKEWAKDKKYPDPIIIAEKMGPWVKNNLDYLKAALYEICQT